MRNHPDRLVRHDFVEVLRIGTLLFRRLVRQRVLEDGRVPLVRVAAEEAEEVLPVNDRRLHESTAPIASNSTAISIVRVQRTETVENRRHRQRSAALSEFPAGSVALSDDELAFYDALETNDSAVKVLGDETLRIVASARSCVLPASAGRG